MVGKDSPKETAWRRVVEGDVSDFGRKNESRGLFGLAWVSFGQGLAPLDGGDGADQFFSGGRFIGADFAAAILKFLQVHLELSPVRPVESSGAIFFFGKIHDHHCARDVFRLQIESDDSIQVGIKIAGSDILG